jgi:predicted acyltransferase
MNTIAPNRLVSADIYRGFVMFLMMAEVLNFHSVAEALPDSSFWAFLAYHQDHVEWVGCSLHDLIQPSFSFLVGVVLPFSILSRQQKGDNTRTMYLHAAKRALILIFFGIFLRSQGREMTNFTFEDTLTQIGLGYFFLFALGFQSFRFQTITFIVILIGYWLAFAFFPLPNSNFNYEAIHLTKDWEHNLQGFAAHWNKNTNLAWSFDQWFLNIFPRMKEFVVNKGGYVTLSFIPTLATMILGLMAGNYIKTKGVNMPTVKTFLILGVAGLILGFLLGYLGICPVVKRIWTPAWVVFSGGWCFIFLAFFHWICDIKQRTNWAFWLLVIGSNSIAAYVLAHTVDGYISDALFTHLGKNYSEFFGISYKKLVHGGLILFFEWLMLLWLYRRKIFIRI